MNFREAIEDSITTLIETDSDAIDAIPDIALKSALPSIEYLEELGQTIDRIFGEDGEAYMGEVFSAFERLRALDIDVGSVFPNAANLRYVLEVANALTAEQIEEQVPDDLHGFRLDEAVHFESAYQKSGGKVLAFLYEHPMQFSDSIGYLDTSAAEHSLASADFDNSARLNAIVTLLLARTDLPLLGRRWVVSSCADAVRREYILRYHLLLKGNLLTSPVDMPNYNWLGGIGEKLTQAGEFRQFREPFEILSEINSRKTILDSFLSAYHTLENYMVRAKIVEVESKHNGNSFFSIRNFKSMNLALDGSEFTHLKALFKECWSKEIGGAVFSTFVATRVVDMHNAVGGWQAPELQSFLRKLDAPGDLRKIKVNNNNNNNSEASQTIAKLIYQVRCSIVHNKETEYHLANRELADGTIRSVLTELCIPVMHRLAFGLPSVLIENPIRYSRQAIELF